MANFNLLVRSSVFDDLLRIGRKITQKMVGQQKHVAIALKKNKIISVGMNSYVKTHPKQAYFAKLAGQDKRQFLHAEVDALIRGADADTLIVLRFSKKGELRNAKPCPVCMEAIKASKVKCVIHS
jgi:deoxycytidylate deaminase